MAALVGRLRIHNAQARSDLVRASRQPGVSLAKIARTCGINANVLSNWVRQHERSKCGSAAPQGEVIEMPAASAFVALQIDSPPLPPASAPVAPAPRVRHGAAELRGVVQQEVHT